MDTVSVTRTHLAKTDEAIELRPSTPDMPGKGWGKPPGFWYQVDDDWLRWCSENEWGTDSLNFVHDVDLGSTNMLFINNERELLDFHKAYGLAGYSRASQLVWALVMDDYVHLGATARPRLVLLVGLRLGRHLASERGNGVTHWRS